MANDLNVWGRGGLFEQAVQSKLANQAAERAKTSSEVGVAQQNADTSLLDAKNRYDLGLRGNAVDMQNANSNSQNANTNAYNAETTRVANMPVTPLSSKAVSQLGLRSYTPASDSDIATFRNANSSIYGSPAANQAARNYASGNPSAPTTTAPAPTLTAPAAVQPADLTRARNSMKMVNGVPTYGYANGGKVKSMKAMAGYGKGGKVKTMIGCENGGQVEAMGYAKSGKIGDVDDDTGEDTIPAKVRPGEYMLNPETVAHIGGGNYDQGVRHLNQIVRQATGKEPGPTLLKKGEAGFADSGEASRWQRFKDTAADWTTRARNAAADALRTDSAGASAGATDSGAGTQTGTGAGTNSSANTGRRPNYSFDENIGADSAASQRRADANAWRAERAAQDARFANAANSANAAAAEGPARFSSYSNPTAPVSSTLRGAGNTVLKFLPSAESIGTGVRTVAKVARPAAALMDAVDVGSVAMDKDTTGKDVTNEIAGKAGRWSSALATAGALQPAILAAGTASGPFAPITIPALELGAGVLGYWGGDKAVEGVRGMLGMDTRDPSKILADRRAAAIAQQQQAAAQQDTAPAAPKEDKAAAPETAAAAAQPSLRDMMLYRLQHLDDGAYDSGYSAFGAKERNDERLRLLQELGAMDREAMQTGATAATAQTNLMKANDEHAKATDERLDSKIFTTKVVDEKTGQVKDVARDAETANAFRQFMAEQGVPLYQLDNSAQDELAREFSLRYRAMKNINQRLREEGGTDTPVSDIIRANPITSGVGVRDIGYAGTKLGDWFTSFGENKPENELVNLSPVMGPDRRVSYMERVPASVAFRTPDGNFDIEAYNAAKMDSANGKSRLAELLGKYRQGN